MSCQVEEHAYGNAIAWGQGKKASLSISCHLFGDAVHRFALAGLLFIWKQSDMMLKLSWGLSKRPILIAANCCCIFGWDTVPHPFAMLT